MKPSFTFSALTLALSMHVGVANANDATEIFNSDILSQPATAPVIKDESKKVATTEDVTADKESKNDSDSDENKKEEKEKTFADIVEGMAHMPGYMDIYQDEDTGAAKLVIEPSMLNTPVLYFAQTVNGVVDAGHFEGAYRSENLIEFRQYFDRLDIVRINDNFYFDPENPLSKVANANTSEALLISTKIEFDEEGKIVVDLSDVVMSEDLHKISPYPSRDPKADKNRFKPGKLSKTKTRLNRVDNFPENTHIVVDYVYENPTPRNFGTGGSADARFTTISLQHAFVKLPENNFEPRVDDARVGYFGTYKDDQTDPGTTPYVDYINRWHLEKKDPDADVSDPVKPIVWWIENTTPLEWRETIKEGVLAWNSSFEKAGISNALEVRIQPDDATGQLMMYAITCYVGLAHHALVLVDMGQV